MIEALRTALAWLTCQETTEGEQALATLLYEAAIA